MPKAPKKTQQKPPNSLRFPPDLLEAIEKERQELLIKDGYDYKVSGVVFRILRNYFKNKKGAG